MEGEEARLGGGKWVYMCRKGADLPAADHHEYIRPPSDSKASSDDWRGAAD